MRTLLTSLPAKIALLLLVLLVGFGGGWVAHAERQPHCPTEDSCKIGYRDGAWHIEKDVP